MTKDEQIASLTEALRGRQEEIGRLNGELARLTAERHDIIERAIACVPGGSICDPQQVADAIRALDVEVVRAPVQSGELPYPAMVKGALDYYSAQQMRDYGKALWQQALGEADLIHKGLIKTMAEAALARPAIPAPVSTEVASVDLEAFAREVRRLALGYVALHFTDMHMINAAYVVEYLESLKSAPIDISGIAAPAAPQAVPAKEARK